MSKLIVVESPAKARTIKKYLGGDWDVKASMGHVRDLPKNKLGVDLDAGFEPTYETIRGKGKVLTEIRKASKKADEVFLAPDPDREGEAIAWHIAEEIREVNPNIRRVLFHEITRSAIVKALDQPFELDAARFDAQQARRVLDRLVGYLVSPVLWRKVRRGLSAGRVQSVAVRLIIEREAEIEAFIPEEYWDIAARLAGEAGPAWEATDPFRAKLHRLDGKKARVTNGEDAARIKQAIDGGALRITAVEKKESKRRPSPPYITSTLQQDASRLLRLPAARTMQLAQRLYEGVDFGEEGPVALITYMRTDSTRTSPEALDAVRGLIDQRYGGDYLPGKAIVYKTKKGAQDAHEAIRPTSLEYPPDRVRAHLDNDAFALYRLIWTRFVASQMMPAIYDDTVVDIGVGDAGADGGHAIELRARGRVLRFDGYQRAIAEGRAPRKKQADDADDGAEEKDDALLPALHVDQVLRLVKPGVSAEQKFTQPPARYSEASLIRTLEEQGIGRPSTYAQIIQTVQKRGYVEKKKGRFHPTELGRVVTHLLVGAFPDVLNVKFTAGLEAELDQIEDGEREWRQVLETFFQRFSKDLDRAEEAMENLRREGLKAEGHSCEKCGSPMAVKIGQRDAYLACTNYPACSNMLSFTRDDKGVIHVERPEELDRACPECGGPLAIRNGRFGRFISCTCYPECRYTENITTGIGCPRKGCAGELAEKRTRRGKTFWSCSEYPKCDYATWDRPVEKPCPDCNFPFLGEKVARRGGSRLVCPSDECSYKAPVKESA